MNSKEKGELRIFLTSPSKSQRFVGSSGPTSEGDMVHIAQIINQKLGYEESAKLILLISIDLFKKDYWGPFQVGENIWNPDLRSQKKISDLVHIYGYQKIKEVRTETSKTKDISALPFYEWQIIWGILNLIRDERIENRIKNPRKNGGKFRDDLLDAFLSRAISRVNAVINDELFWGRPIDDSHYFSFNKSGA